MNFTKGDIVVPESARYPEGALLVDGYDEIGRLLAHPIGGGIEIRIDKARAEGFRVVSDEEKRTVSFQACMFRAPQSEALFEGWTDGQLSEGWETPRFESAICNEILQVTGGHHAWYDYRADAFVVVNGDMEQSYPAEKIITSDGAQITVYALGAGVWMWERVALN
jgi:hypothetical protein